MTDSQETEKTVRVDGMTVHRIDTMKKVHRLPKQSRSTSQRLSSSSNSINYTQKFRAMEQTEDTDTSSPDEEPANPSNPLKLTDEEIQELMLSRKKKSYSSRSLRKKRKRSNEENIDEQSNNNRKRRRVHNNKENSNNTNTINDNNDNNNKIQKRVTPKQTKRDQNKNNKTKNRKRGYGVLNRSGIYRLMLKHTSFNLFKYNNQCVKGEGDNYSYIVKFFQGTLAGGTIVFNMIHDTNIPFKTNGIAKNTNSRHSLDVNTTIKYLIERCGMINVLRAIKKEGRKHKDYIDKYNEWYGMAQQKLLTESEFNALIRCNKMIVKAIKNEKGTGIDIEKCYQESKEPYTKYYEQNDDSVNMYWTNILSRDIYNEIKGKSNAIEAAEEAQNKDNCPSPIDSIEPIEAVNSSSPNTNNANTKNTNNTNNV